VFNVILILTGSEGTQEETTALRIPCLMLCETTERPITVERGTNIVVGTAPERLIAEPHKVLESRRVEENRSTDRAIGWENRITDFGCSTQ
jgi:UDP-N-acetylglucosamine 2-epimerase